MDYKAVTYEIQDKYLSRYACKDADTRGRAVAEEPCAMRTEFQRDRDRIIHSKAFRRLKHKTHAFVCPESDHFRTRLTHTLEVSQIARTIARCLRLNEDLTEAIALGHDLGHTPYGHAGERGLSGRTHFSHNEQGLRVVDVIEKDGKGMNLTAEVRDGILCHSGERRAFTLEGRVVHLADRVAYLNHDIDDSLRAGVLDGIPEEYERYFGATNSKRISTMILDIINNSYGKDDVMPTPECKSKMDGLRAFMFEKVYFGVCMEESQKATRMIQTMYDYFLANPNDMPEWYRNESATPEQRVCDYISGMTDNYCNNVFERMFVPTSWGRKD